MAPNTIWFFGGENVRTSPRFAMNSNWREWMHRIVSTQRKIKLYQYKKLYDEFWHLKSIISEFKYWNEFFSSFSSHHTVLVSMKHRLNVYPFMLSFSKYLGTKKKYRFSLDNLTKFHKYRYTILLIIISLMIIEEISSRFPDWIKWRRKICFQNLNSSYD